MEHFFARKKELADLEALYRQQGFQMAVIYGRRRIGKSMLISEFIRDKKAIYHIATKAGAGRNRELLAKQALEVLEPSLAGVRFDTIEGLFDFITSHIQEERLILVIDELPYWATSEESLLSILQKYADSDWREKNLMLILCGSALSFMEEKVLSEKSPLFGRRSLQIHLREFDYRESALFVPDYSCEEKAIVYGITGGVAKYLALFNHSESLDQNIVRLFFERNGYLHDEPQNLLSQEFSDISVLQNVLEQIAGGENALHLIADKAHEKESVVLYALGRLMSVGIVEKRKAVTEKKNKKKTHYVLCDHMFRFWYQFLPEAESAIALDRGEVYYSRIVRPRLHEFMGYVFEDMCRQFTLQKGLDGGLKCFVTEVGSWWGTVRSRDGEGVLRNESTDIDVVGLSPSEKKMVVGECKFKNEKLDASAYEKLAGRAASVKFPYPVCQYLLFSLSGFGKELLDEASGDITCVTIEEMYQGF